MLAEVAQTVDRVLIISRGRLVLSSPLADLTARADGAVRVRSADPQRLTTALRDQALQVTAGTDHALLVQVITLLTGLLTHPSGLMGKETSASC